MLTKIYILLLTIFLLSACTPDPRKQADADNSRTLTTETAADQKQKRTQDQSTYAEKLASFKQVWNANFPVIAFAINVVTIALSLCISLALVGTGSGIGYAGLGLGKTAVRKAEVKATLIPMDRATRSFPLHLQHLGRGIFTIHNANTGSVIQLDISRSEERSLITAISKIQYAGVLAYETSQAPNGNPAIGTRAVIEQFEHLINQRKESHVPANN